MQCPKFSKWTQNKIDMYKGATKPVEFYQLVHTMSRVVLDLTAMALNICNHRCIILFQPNCSGLHKKLKYIACKSGTLASFLNLYLHKNAV